MKKGVKTIAETKVPYRAEMSTTNVKFTTKKVPRMYDFNNDENQRILGNVQQLVVLMMIDWSRSPVYLEKFHEADRKAPLRQGGKATWVVGEWPHGRYLTVTLPKKPEGYMGYCKLLSECI